MKRIVKNPEPNEFLEWKDKWRTCDIEPGWGEFDTKPIKQIVKQSLLIEQGYLCCYCEVSLDEHCGHIAHLLDQRHKRLVLAYENLLYSCAEQPKSIPQTCGHAQRIAVLPISPLDDDCEDRFLYTRNGKIFPRKSGDHDAEETIRILNLNAKRLVDSREQTFQEVFEERSRQSSSDFQNWINKKLERTDNRFTEFWTVKKYVSTIDLDGAGNI